MKQNNHPRISVILPIYNRGDYIAEAIESVIVQTFTDFEIIVIDDGSTDGTAGVIKSFSDSRIRYIYQSNCGRSNARNQAFSVANGQYIAFLDSDDLYLPNKLELQVRYLDTHPSVGMVYTSAYCIDKNGSLLDDSYKATVSGWIYEDVAFYVPVTITLPTVMVRYEVFDQVGGFDERMERFEDTDLWRRVSKEFIIEAIPEFTCKLRTHDNNALVAQNPRKLETAIYYYINKIFSEDRSISHKIRCQGASELYYYYAMALFSVSSIYYGVKLITKSICYKPRTVFRLLYSGFTFLSQRGNN